MGGGLWYDVKEQGGERRGGERRVFWRREKGGGWTVGGGGCEDGITSWNAKLCDKCVKAMRGKGV